MSIGDDRSPPEAGLGDTPDVAPTASPSEPGDVAVAPGGGIARRRRRTVIIAGLVLLAVAALSWLAGRATTTTSSLASSSASPKPPQLTAQVVKRRLGTTLQAPGKLVAAGIETITVGSINVPGAESIVTARVLHVGEQIGNGRVIAQVAGRPVFVFAGSTPMYRSLSAGESGPDIAQLQTDLASIGYTITDTSGSYGSSTSAALAALYQHTGNSAPATVPFGGRRNASRVIVEPQSEIVFVRTLPATVAAVNEPVGKAIGTPAVTVTYGSVVVDATLSPAQGYMTEPGDPVTVSLGSGRPLNGVVSAIKRSVTAPHATATIALRGVLAAPHVGSHVMVSIDARSSAFPTVAVPIGALYASGAGSAYVILATGGREHIPVNVGQAVGGYVPIIDPPTTLLPGTELVLDSNLANSSNFGGP